jgi:hypothetical protein
MFNCFLIYNFLSFCIFTSWCFYGPSLKARKMHSLGLHYLDIINSLQLLEGNGISPNIFIKSSHNISWFDVICLKFGVSNLFPKVFIIAPHFITYPLLEIWHFATVLCNWFPVACDTCNWKFAQLRTTSCMKFAVACDSHIIQVYTVGLYGFIHPYFILAVGRATACNYKGYVHTALHVN